MNLKHLIQSLKKSSLKHKIIFLLVLIGLGFLIKAIISKNSQPQTTYQTSTAQIGNLISSISATGTITSGNYNNITTKASGAVSRVYVTNGDTVKKGQKIADITLDDYALERQTASWVTYLEAKENALEAINSQATSDIAMWQARQDILDAQEAYDDMLSDNTNPTTHQAYTEGERTIIIKTLDQTKKAFTVAEAKYSNSKADISYANAKVASAYRNYQENSATIVSPDTGVISDLSLAPGLLLNANSSTSSTSGATIVSAQTVGKINNTTGQLIATVNLTEIDVVKVKANQKVNITLDAYPDNTFTGKVLAVNTSGGTNSGVTNYPVTIILDPLEVDIYPNMAVSADIITDIITDVLLVPSTAIKGLTTTSVDVLKDGSVSSVEVEVGQTNDSQTVILSGLNPGDVIITSTITQEKSTSSDTTSPFSGVGTNRSSGGMPGSGMIRGL